LHVLSLRRGSWQLDVPVELLQRVGLVPVGDPHLEAAIHFLDLSDHGLHW
jgi:hypothetical protein